VVEILREGEGSSPYVVALQYLVKLTKSVDEERRTEPAEEGLLCTLRIAQRRQADLINTWRLISSEEERGQQPMARFLARFGEAHRECRRGKTQEASA